MADENENMDEMESSDEMENSEQTESSDEDLTIDDLDLDMDSDLDMGDMGASWDDMDSPVSDSSASSADNKGKILLLMLLIVIGAGSATFIAYKMFGSKGGYRTESRVDYTQEEIPMISEQEAEAISRERSSQRMHERSASSSRFTTELPADPLRSVTTRTDLILIAGLFDNYVVSLSHFFELGRLITNEYLEKQEHIRSIFNSELLPKFNYAERRRKQLHQRITSEQAKSLMANLDYIAYHDSIAVNLLDSYLENGKKEDYIKAIDVGYEAKLMKKDYLKKFNRILEVNNVAWQRDEKLWTKYFGTWDQVEP